MWNRLLRLLSLALCAAVIFAVCPGVQRAFAVGPIVNENFTDGSVTSASLPDRLWTTETGITYPSAGYNGNFEVRTGPNRMKISKNRDGQEDESGMSYKVQKLFSKTTPSFHYDPRLTLRNEQFKGIYDIEYDVSFNMPANATGMTFLDVIGHTADGGEGVISAIGANPEGIHVLSGGQNGEPSPSRITLSNDLSRHKYRIRMDFINETEFPAQGVSSPAFQVFLDGSTTPASGPEGISPSDVFPITGEKASYMTGMWFGFENQSPTNGSIYINMYTFRMTEIEKQHDLTDDALALLDMSTLTATPADVTADLLPLPDSFESVPGVGITWSSGNPEILTDEGRIAARPRYDTNVTMTAAVTNLSDRFTQYLDFELTITGTENLPPTDGVMLVNERFTNGSVKAEDLEGLGWSVLQGVHGTEYDCDAANGSFAIQSEPAGLKLTRLENKTGTSAPMNYGVCKKFSVKTPSYLGNPRLTLRNEHFKGIYDIEYDTQFDVASATGMTYFYTVGSNVGGEEAVLSQLGGARAGVSVINRGEGGAAEQTLIHNDALGRHRYRTRLDFTRQQAPGFQVFLDGSGSPLSGSDGLDTFPMTNKKAPDTEPSYLTGMWVGFQPQMPDNGDVGLMIYSLRLVEIEKAYDPTEDVLRRLATGKLAEQIEAVTRDIELPTSFADISDVEVAWSSDRPDVISSDGRVNASYYDTDVRLTAQITNTKDRFTQWLDLAVTVKGTAPPTEPGDGLIFDFTFDGKTPEQLAETGIEILDSRAGVAVNEDGNLLITKTTEENPATSFEQTYAVRLATRRYGVQEDGGRTVTFSNKLKGRYEIDAMLRATGFESATRDNQTFGFTVNGAGSWGGNPNGASLFFGQGKNSTIAALPPDYTKEATVDLKPVLSEADSLEGKWVLYRISIDSEAGTADQVHYSYAVGSQTEKPDESELEAFGGQNSEIPFGAAGAEGLKRYAVLSDPQLGFTEAMPVGAAMEVAYVKVYEHEKAQLQNIELIDRILAAPELTLSALTDRPDEFIGTKSPLPNSVTIDGAAYPIKWKSENPAVVSNTGAFIGGDGHRGETVYLTATVRIGETDKSKRYRLVAGSLVPPVVSNAEVKGDDRVGGVLTLSYSFRDPYDKGDASAIVWQRGSGNSFSDIRGATGKTYTVSALDAGRSIRAVIYPQNEDGAKNENEIVSNTVHIQSGGTAGGGGGGKASWSGSGTTVDISNLPPANSGHNGENETTFFDVSKAHWASEAVCALAEMGVLAGDGNRYFRPGESMTREELSKVLVLTFGLMEEDAVSEFWDISKFDWSYPYIASLEQYEIVLGDDEGRFRKNDLITREDLAVMLKRLMYRLNIPAVPERSIVFSDSQSIADYAKIAVNSLANAGIINGEDGAFQPKRFCTRAEAAKLVYGVYARSAAAVGEGEKSGGQGSEDSTEQPAAENDSELPEEGKEAAE